MEPQTTVKSIDKVNCYDICQGTECYAVGFNTAVKICSLRSEEHMQEAKVDDGCYEIRFSADGSLIGIITL